MAYGFKERPIDQSNFRKSVPNIPEERLFSVNSQVIEFKKPAYSEEDDEDSEFDDDDENESAERYNRRKPEPAVPYGYSYSDIGFKTSRSKDPRFVNVPVSTTPRPRCPKGQQELDYRSFGAVVPVDEVADRDHYYDQHGCCAPFEDSEASAIYT